MGKKIAIGFGVFIAVILAVMIIVPLVVDVDKYRPDIIKVANENLNGKLELGKLKLSLWGQIKVEVAGTKLIDQKGTSVVSVKDAFFHIPFSNLLGGSPVITFKMEKPEIHVVKGKDGKLNLMALMKESKAAPSSGSPAAGSHSAPQTKTSSTSGGAKEKSTLPAMAVNARLGIEIRNALIGYQDLAGGIKTEIKDMNIIIKDMSISRPTELELWADFDTAVARPHAEPITVKGPAKLVGQFKPEISGTEFESFKMSLKGNFDDLDVLVPGTFHKKKGIDAHFDMGLRGTQTSMNLEKLDLKFFNADVQASTQMTNAPVAVPGQKSQPMVAFKMKSNEIELKPWSELLPAMKDGELSGVAHLNADASGPADAMKYKAEFGIKNLTAKAPNLKSQPQFDLLVKVITDQIESFSFTMKAPANDLHITGKLISFTKPQLSMNVSSSGMDLDQLINFPPPPPAGSAAKGEASASHSDHKEGEKTGSETASKSSAPAADFDAMLAPLRDNPMMAQMGAQIGIDIKMLKAKGVKMTDMTGKMSLKDLAGGLDSFSMKMWNGTVKASMTAALKPATPTYRFSADISKLDFKEAVTSQMEMIKNTLVGIASFKMDGTGSSFNPDPAKKNLKASGNFKVEKAKFATIDITKATFEALSKSMEKIAQKVPQAKGKTIKQPGNKESRYEVISSNFEINDGRFSAPNFVAKAEPNQGIDLKGTSAVGLIDYSLKANWEVIDTYNLTGARDLSVDQAGVKVDHILAEGNGPVKFPLTIGGTVFQPVYSYTEVPEKLAAVAMKNVSGAATDKAKSEAKKKIEQKIEQAAPPAVKDKLKGLNKKLFGG